MSKIKVDQIEGSTGSTITIPTGQSLVVTDGLGTASLPTIPTTKGGTGLTSLGTAGQALLVNAGATGLEFGDVATDFSAVGESIIPSTTDTYDLGSASFVWRNIYTGDLHLSNEAKEQGNSVDGTKGNWTIQEGADDLFIVNNKSGKKYKFKLEEI